MYKALGIVLIFSSLGFFSYKTVQTKRCCLLNLREFKKALTVLKNELGFSMSEISSLCKKVSDMTSGEVSSVFKSIEKTLNENSSADFFTAWNLQTCKKQLFSKEAMAEITNFCENFGKKTIDIELENIKRCEKNLEQLNEEEREKYIKDRKLIYTFTAAIGTVIVIIGI